MVEGIAYGPSSPGTYYAQVKLANGREFSNAPFTLHSPEPENKIRTYNYRFYFEPEYNRWLFSPTIIDTN